MELIYICKEMRTQTSRACLFLLLPDFLRELCVGDQEAGDAAAVQEADEGVDFGVHDGLTHQGEGAVPDGQALLVALGLHSGDTWRGERPKGVTTGEAGGAHDK